MFRPIRMDHTNCLQVAIKTLHSLKNLSGDAEVAGTVRYCLAFPVLRVLLVLLSPHQRVCVVGHLLRFHVGLKLGFTFERGQVEIRGSGTNSQEYCDNPGDVSKGLLLVHVEPDFLPVEFCGVLTHTFSTPHHPR